MDDFDMFADFPEDDAFHAQHDNDPNPYHGDYSEDGGDFPDAEYPDPDYEIACDTGD